MQTTKQTSLPAGWVRQIRRLNRDTRYPRSAMRERYSLFALLAAWAIGVIYLLYRGP